MKVGDLVMMLTQVGGVAGVILARCRHTGWFWVLGHDAEPTMWPECQMELIS